MDKKIASFLLKFHHVYTEKGWLLAKRILCDFDDHLADQEEENKEGEYPDW